MKMIIQKPAEGEYPAYAVAYIKLTPDDGLVLKHLQDNLASTPAFIASFPPEKLTTRLAEGEWTIKEILGHIMDTERIFAYRALRLARHDPAELAGFNQDDYVPYSRANERAIEEILDEYVAVRRASLALFNSLDEEAFARKGIVNKNNLSVRAAVFLTLGHELHHLNSIRENYL